MIYSEVVKTGLILERKRKYTMVDVNKVMLDSLFTPVNNATLSLNEAIFIVKCSAIYHGTDYSKTLSKRACM